MNMYTSTRGFGKGVSLWIPITVFLSVMALIFTLLPSTSAQAQETTMEELTISETTDSIVDSTQSLPVDGGDAPPGVIEEGPVIVDDVPAPDVVNEEGNSVIDDLLGLITPQQAQAPTNWGNLAQDIVIVGEGSNPGDPIRVGENVDISGRWDGRGLDIQEGDSFEIQFPEVVTLIPLEFDLVFGTTDDWGTCAPDMAGNRYVCTIDVLPGVQTYGIWEASARATQESTEYNIIGSDYSLGKEGGILYLGGNLLDQPAGTVTRWMATIDAQNPVTLPDPIVLTDTFSPNLEICANPAVTDLEVRHGGVTYRDIATYTQTGPNTMTITINPPTGGFEIGLVPADPIEVLYQLCTASGGLDPVGTEYTNTVEWGTLGADAQVTQTRSTSGTIVALNRGTFDLNKVVNAPVPPATIPVPGTITVQVEEFEPGEYPDGTPEATYTVLVNTDGTIVNGQNSRPDGWTIRLTELPPAEIPGYTWGTPEFSGDGVVTGTDTEGRPYAVITTTQSGNVALQLDNYLSPNTPEIGTVARVEGSADNILPLTGGTVVDTVRYENLEPNTEYRLDGEIVAVDEDGTVTETGITSSDTFTTGDAPAGQSLVSGTTTVTFTLTAAQAERWAGQRLVVYERLFEPAGPTPDVPVTVHEDPEDEEQTFFVDEGEPLIGTLAQVQGNNPKLLPLTGGEVVDTVSYRFLTPETEYRLDGELMHVDEDGTVTATGIISDITFTTPAAEPGENYVSGTVDVTFTITAEQAYRYGGESLVVYERLFEPSGPTPDVPVTVHEDPEDEDQTFRVEDREPEIGTLAQVQGDNPKLLPLTGGDVVDTVSYTDLLPNTEYRLDGELMHVATNGTVTPTGITSDATFITPAAEPGESYVSGTVDVTFTLTAAQAYRYGGESLVVYERLFEPSSPTPDVPVVVHEDPEDEDQTFRVEEREPLLRTLAQVQGPDPKLLPLTGGTVVDTISYTDLRPNTVYRIEGELMHVADAQGPLFAARQVSPAQVLPPEVTPTGIIGITTFTTPAAAPGENYVSGTTEVSFDITAEQAYQYAGERLVIFEILYDTETGETILEHVDPEDQDQTFLIQQREPEIGTLAQVQGDNPKLLPLTGGTVVDTVSYTDLLPNTEYRLDGELMHVDEDGTVTATGITSDTTFTTPAAADGENYVSGTVDVTFTISAADAVEYAGESLVVYERLFQPSGPTPDVPVTVHEDPEDEDQTFRVEPGGTIVVGKTVTGPKGDDVENDDDAVFQIRAEWIDSQGDEQSRTFNVTPGQPVALDGLPLDTEITLTEIGADTSVSNVKWGDIIWSGTGVVDEPGASPNGTVTLTEPGAEIEVGLENKTSSNGLIIIPIPLPLFPGGEPPVPPAAPVTPTPPPQAAPAVPEVSPKDGIQPSPKDGIQPQRGAAPQAQQKTGLAATGADVVWLAGGGIMILLLGAWLVLRGRRNES